MISLLQQNEIDKSKWNNCILNAPNSLIYAEYDYLDIMCKKWCALVLNDYETVMPLPYNRKYGITYLYQPFFCASLGIFGNNLNQETVSLFLNAVPKTFSYWDIYLNKANYFVIENYHFDRRLNLVLSLNKPYYSLSGAFAKNHIKSISLGAREGMNAYKNIHIDEIINLAAAQSKKYSPIRSADYDRFKKLYNLFLPLNKAVTYGVYNNENQLTASAVFFTSNARAYYILVGNHPKGRNLGASHILINEFIKDYSEQDIILDFEGSNIESIARFYKGFGAAEEIYPGLRINRLPPILRLFRK